MPSMIITCPKCQSPLSFAGRASTAGKLKCGKCGATLTVGVPASPVAQAVQARPVVVAPPPVPGCEPPARVERAGPSAATVAAFCGGGLLLLAMAAVVVALAIDHGSDTRVAVTPAVQKDNIAAPPAAVEVVSTGPAQAPAANDKPAAVLPPSQVAPTVPVPAAPTVPVQPPVTPTEPAPTAPSPPAPESAPSVPAKPAPTTPAEPPPILPVKPAPTRPVEPAPTVTVKPAPTPAVEPEPPAPTAPAQPAPAKPVEPAPTIPAKPAPAEPAPAYPLEPEPATRAKTAPAIPGQPARGPQGSVPARPSPAAPLTKLGPPGAGPDPGPAFPQQPGAMESPPLSEPELQQILQVLASKNIQLIGAALLRLAQVQPQDAQRDRVVSALQPLTTVAQYGLNISAMRALGIWANRDTVPILLAALSTKTVSVRHEAMRVLGQLKDERAVDQLARRLGSSADRLAASRALQRLGAAAEKTVIAYLKDNDIFVRSEACKILEVIGTRESVGPLNGAVKDSNSRVRAAAQIALTAVQARKK